MNISNNSITEIDDFPKKIGALVCEKIPEDIKYRMIVLSGCNDSAREIFGDFVSLS